MISGKISSFGGINDKVDRLNNLARIKMHGSPLETVRYYQNTPLKGLFVPLWEAVKIAQNHPDYGLSGYLDTEFPYYADRTSEIPKRYGTDSDITVFNYLGRSIMALRIDFGPALYTGRKWDLSPGAMKFLNAQTDNVVSARPATKLEKILFWQKNYRNISDSNYNLLPMVLIGFLLMKGFKK